MLQSFEAWPSQQSLSLTDWMNQGTGVASSNSVSRTLGVAGTHAIANPVDAQRFLRFSLNEATTALLPLDSIQEVSQIPYRGLLPVPEMPDAVLGVASCRGAIVWLVELAKLIGVVAQPEFSGLEPSRQLASFLLQTITIHAEGQSLGLVVPCVMDIEHHDAQSLRPPHADLFPAHLVPFLAGYLDESCSPVLSASALIETLQMQH
ncbi:MAG: chemotaxis protein CheW [Synechococcales cyanobacterium RU_4_20]|nr:chemotaxis protein CheW [Synechococcales cyanobacterium RU_4_20]NJR68497.1 chemotaxis protein CheW [Synechococcales cyanobacterium CRU_2_2]